MYTHLFFVLSLMLASLYFSVFFFYLYCDHRDLPVLTHPFPTRRSSVLPLPWLRSPRSATRLSCWRLFSRPASSGRGPSSAAFSPPLSLTISWPRSLVLRCPRS